MELLELSSKLSQSAAQTQSSKSRQLAHMHQWVEFISLAETFQLRHGNSNMAEAFISTYLHVKIILCIFHVKQSWVEKMGHLSLKQEQDFTSDEVETSHPRRKLKVSELQNDPFSGINPPDMCDAEPYEFTDIECLRNAMYSWFVYVQKSTTWLNYDLRVTNLYRKFSRYPQITDYFTKNWDTPFWQAMWVQAGRVYKGRSLSHTNLQAELHFRLLKHHFLAGMVNRRPGDLLDLLVGIPKNPVAIASSMLGYYTRRLEDLKLAKYAPRAPVALQRVKKGTELLWQAYFSSNVQTMIQCRNVDLGIWQVSLNDLDYTCCPQEGYCTCERQDGFCVHIAFVGEYLIYRETGEPPVYVAVAPLPDKLCDFAPFQADIDDVYVHHSFEEVSTKSRSLCDLLSSQGESLSEEDVAKLNGLLNKCLNVIETSHMKHMHCPKIKAQKLTSFYGTQRKRCNKDDLLNPIQKGCHVQEEVVTPPHVTPPLPPGVDGSVKNIKMKNIRKKRRTKLPTASHITS